MLTVKKKKKSSTEKFNQKVKVASSPNNQG